MYKNKNVRLYHPKEVEAMKKVLRRLGKHARKKKVQKAMWDALREVRLELKQEIHEQKTNNDTPPSENG